MELCRGRQRAKPSKIKARSSRSSCKNCSYHCAQYCSIETVLLSFPSQVPPANITSEMWPSGGKSGKCQSEMGWIWVKFAVPVTNCTHEMYWYADKQNMPTSYNWNTSNNTSENIFLLHTPLNPISNFNIRNFNTLNSYQETLFSSSTACFSSNRLWKHHSRNIPVWQVSKHVALNDIQCVICFEEILLYIVTRWCSSL